ncbi:alkyl/aryl-sulfatase [Streptomyces sp. NPDC048305]|uniref:alkyl/aryl-sulfatase n=1 Tax=Streptomyces sp. NPDC048305 TaxID=3365532 RepID=UPI0037223121
MNTERTTATAATRAARVASSAGLDFADRGQYEDAARGFLGTIDPCVIHDADGEVVWDLRKFDFLSGAAPDTVHPSLWRNAQLNSGHGLFEVTDRLYQVRGFDMANMSVVVGDSGYLVIDPLTTVEPARAALDLVREHLGDRPVTAVVYTHSHADHFGGAKGVLITEEAAEREVPVIAPAGFLEHAVSENVYAGNAMNRRAAFMYGMHLPDDERGQLGTGLGHAPSRGRVTLLAPDRTVTTTGQELVVDGVRMVFQLVSGTESPADMNIHFPDLNALCMADNLVHSMHNLYTPRGAEVRDGRAWSDHLNESIELFGAGTDVIFLGHQWPVWGREACADALRAHRDLYRYVHDEVLRLANQGHTIHEIPDLVELPEALAHHWSSRGYYGTLSNNCKAVHQKYLGYFDGNPARLDPHPPAEAARRYVDLAGGIDRLLERARAAYDEGDYRWVAELVDHAVFAEPGHAAARELQAAALEQLGYQAESAVSRNFYLSGAHELRHGTPPPSVQVGTADVAAALTTRMILDALAIRIVGPRAAGHPMTVNLTVTDTGERAVIELSNGALVPTHGRHRPDADAGLSVDKATLALLALGGAPVEALSGGGAVVEGDKDAVAALFSLGEPFDPSFPVVTP